MNHKIAWVPLLAWSLAGAACVPSVTVSTPSGFAVLDDQKEYVYRATSAVGVVLAVRAEKNEPRGNRDFWAAALDRKLRRGGYVPDGPQTEVRTSTGLVGRSLRYTRDESGRKSRFWIAVFVTHDRVWVVEAGGDVERFDEPTQNGIQKAIEALRVD